MSYEPPVGTELKGGFKREKSTGEVIRDFLLENGPSYVQEIWRFHKKWCRGRGYSPPSYQSFRSNHIDKLKKLGLIRFVREEESEFGEPRRYYELNTDLLDDDPAWRNPQKAYQERRGYE